MQPSCAFSLLWCFHSSSYFILPNFLCQSFSFVTLLLFSARCDQLTDISATDIAGDRTLGGHGLLHLLSFRLPSVSSLHTWLTLHSCSSSQITDLAPLLGLLCKLVLSSLTEAIVTYPPLLCLSNHLSSFFFSLYVLATWWHWHIFLFVPSSLSAPTLFHSFTFPVAFAFLYLALSRLPFTMRDLSFLLYANRSPVS